ncbi:hypothetical protein BIU82_05695 [Arthrobacter sp. SW1]|uniref:hypothetical protein n=1 Tax=Arthrobacter sp. SW1 TaxID=1920889 RepID=UPI000877E788|nr:hypothetical protein [Arthrobacter sp. SW1]OFI37998.1 hypothetical protein BIU82_05695 [Arthrobacter sp. SW1]
MPWWSWILLWVALISVSLLFYVLIGIRLFRKAMATLRELSEAGAKFGRLPEAPETAEDDGGRHLPVPGSAIFASPEQMRHDYFAAKASRQELRRQRRVKRKAERGQPQSLHDIEIS